MDSENIYLIKLTNENEEFYKIGLTVNKFCRFYQIMKYGYDIEIIYMAFGLDCFEAFDAEKELQRHFNSYIPKKWFGGYTECFTFVGLDRFKGCLEKLITKKPDKIIEGLKITWR